MKLIFENIGITFNNYHFVFLLGCIVFIMITFETYGQQKSAQDTIKAKRISAIRVDTTKSKVSYNNQSTIFHKDTVKDQHTEVSPLDIASNRGIFILSADHMLQLRILGSVRANFNYTDQDLLDERTFNPFEISTGLDTRSPNFFIGLNQSRLGFEVTRRTKTRGDIFIRIESDFQGFDGSFRIRHAYGQIGGILVGQTWSLFNNVSYLPATVSKTVGRIGLRTPQLRYSRTINKNMTWNAAIEFSSPVINIPDSINGTLLQVIPDLTGKYSYRSDRISFRISAVISTISGRVDSSAIEYSFGFGGSFSGSMKLKKNGRIYLSVTSGKAISHFMDLFHDKGEDIAFNPQKENFRALTSTSGYLGYSRKLPKNFSANISFGMAAISNKDFQPGDTYSYSYNALLNAFWAPVQGARVGLEYANGQRFDKDGSRGIANRVSLLIYYDF